MTNPWMSLWLSEWHKAANAAKGQMMAEMARQQQAAMAAWTEEATKMWMSVWAPWMAGAAAPQRKRTRR